MAYEMETWNMAEQTLQRLSKILDLCVDSSLREDYGFYFKSLIELKKNISAFLSDTEMDELEEIFNQLPDGWFNPNQKTINQTHKMKVNKIFNDAYVFCIRKMKKKGLLMTEARDVGRAVARMS